MVSVVGPEDSLREALQTYRSRKRGLIEQGEDGRYVLIRGSNVGGVFDSREEGLAAGYRDFGNTAFLVREIREFDRTWHVRPVLLTPSR